jgi:hypothetical protein
MGVIELALLRRDIEREFPTFTLVSKRDSFLMRAISFFLLVVSFGKMRKFMTRFTTTLGDTVYTPTDWGIFSPRSQASILRHERVHMRQSREYSRLWFSFLYLFVFFPVGLAWYRAKFEMEAYEESLRAYREYGTDITQPAIRASMLAHFTTAEYLWMFPFKKRLNKWFDDAVQRVLATTKPGVL